MQSGLLRERSFPTSGVGGEFAHRDSTDNTEGQYRTEEVKNEEQNKPLRLFVHLQWEAVALRNRTRGNYAEFLDFRQERVG